MFGESSESGESCSGGRQSTNSKAVTKKKEEIARLRKSNSEYSEYNRRQAAGDIGYQFFSAEKNRQIMRDQEMQIQNLEREVSKLEEKE